MEKRLFEDIDFNSFVFTDSENEDEPDTRAEWQRNGFVLGSHRVTDGVEYHDFSRGVNRGILSWERFSDTVVERLEQVGDQLRNLVLYLGLGMGRVRFISLTRERLLRLGPTLVDGFKNAHAHLRAKRLLEVYEDYNKDNGALNELYGIDLDEFDVSTNRFAYSFDTISTAGGTGIWEAKRTEHVRIEDPPTLYGPNDCFFSCITHATGIEIHVENTRKLIRSEAVVEFKHISRFERASNIQIIVYADNLVEGELEILHKSEIANPSRTVRMVLFENHYVLLKEMIRRPIETVPGKILFFDFETYMHPTEGHAVPYAFSYALCDQGKIVEAACITKDSLEEDLDLSVLELFVRFGSSTDPVRLVGFNNGAFDDYLLIDILTRETGKLRSVQMDSRARVLRFVWKNLVSQDLYRFLMTSLREAAKGFECTEEKGDFNHREIQDAVEHGTYSLWHRENRDKLVEYSLGDVTTLADLYGKVSKAFRDLDVGLDMESSLTLSHMSMKAFRKSFCRPLSIDENRRYSLPVLSRKYDIVVRKALVGGRCQIFQKGIEENHELQCIDVVSLYPFVMMNREYPYLFEEKDSSENRWKRPSDEKWMRPSQTIVQGKFGVYRVHVVRQPNSRVIPNRNKDGTLDWDPADGFETWSDSITLQCLQRHGGEFRVLEGYYVDLPSGPIFKSYLGPIVAEKQKEDALKASNKKYNKAKRNALKLVMNSLSGKMIQKPNDKERSICDNENSIKTYLKKYGKGVSFVRIDNPRNHLWLVECAFTESQITPTSPSIVGIMIYAYAREYMYDHFISKVEHKYGMDTDSLFLRSSELANIDQNLFGDMCGQVKTELPPGCYGAFAAKKMYAFYQKCANGNRFVHKLKFKGLSKSDKLVSSEDEFATLERIRSNNYKALGLQWKSAPVALTLESIFRIAQGDQIHVLCSHIQKVFSSKTVHFRITSKFVLKKIPAEECDGEFENTVF